MGKTGDLFKKIRDTKGVRTMQQMLFQAQGVKHVGEYSPVALDIGNGAEDSNK